MRTARTPEPRCPTKSAATPIPKPGQRLRRGTRPTTGIDYLGLIDTAHKAELADKVNYAALSEPMPPPSTSPT
ncbi:hypothetical protein [Streptomyces lunaelactis]|uniref:hypothetical protein n=1 Tax=Streptomyces lunaelactis TaxID=1535768 RepID=UPI00211D86A7|nr:hypothetical protein [Streptomyces lunaelactis]